MINETQKNKIYYLYRIINKINGKIYIGQTVQPDKRWWQHRHDAANPTQTIHYAINKYGANSFEFEVIASCKNQDDANWTEEELIKQYDSLVKNGKGYNISLGGAVAPKSEEWKQSMRDWHTSLTQEERAEISRKQSEATQQQIAEKGHPAQGTKRTPEQSARLSQARKEHPVEYTEEIRQRMSKAHLGKIDSEETKQRKSESITKAWEKRIDYTDIKCSAPGCDVQGKTPKGKAPYKIINGIRYCNKHGLRMLRYGRLDLVKG